MTVDTERLDQQIEELRGYPNVVSVERDGLKVTVTYDKYEVTSYYEDDTLLLEDLKITLDFSIDRPLYGHEFKFVKANKRRAWKGHYLHSVTRDYNKPTQHNEEGYCISPGIGVARAMSSMRDAGELINILQVLKNHWTTTRGNVGYKAAMVVSELDLEAVKDPAYAEGGLE